MYNKVVDRRKNTYIALNKHNVLSMEINIEEKSILDKGRKFYR